jgi:cytochrome c oxidase subunit 1/cytochrome c oxidase subunit I+III
MDFYAVSLVFLTISTTAGAINFIVTIFRHRAEGMGVSRMPLLMYSTLTVSASIMLSLPPLTAALVFLELDRQWGTHFYDTTLGGSPMLWQQLFWFFGHPWVYVIFLPATGMMSLILPVFARRPIVGYAWVAIATVLTGVVGFGVWIHHMFATGMSQMAMSFFTAASMTISLFSAVQVFAWVATLWQGRPVLTASMHFALGFLAVFVIGGLNGIVTAVIPVDWQLHDTYFVVSHLHYVLVGANVLPVFAAFYFWLPKITGRLMDERLGKWSFWLMFAGFNITFFPMHFLGLQGMPRRIYTYPASTGWGTLNMVETVGTMILTVGILISVWNFFVSLRSGVLAGPNPWNADTLEWDMASPPPVYGSERIPLVATRHPLWDDHDEHFDPADDRTFDHARETVTTSSLDAAPIAVAKMPEESAMPALLALILAAFFTGLLVRELAVSGLALAAAAVTAGAWLWPKPERRIA